MVVATGFFDGVHLGHRQVIDRLVEAARRRGDQGMVVTFWPHPRNVLQKDAEKLRLLTSLREKREMLARLGVDRVEVLRFTREFSALTAEEYLREYVIGRFCAKAVVLGYDNRFGSDGADTASVAATARGLGLEVIVADPVPAPLSENISGPLLATRPSKGGDKGKTVKEEGAAGEPKAISSTLIRGAVARGDMEGAAAMLGYRYSLYGVVVSGNRIGRTLGFPTANMALYEPLKLLPGNGAYLVKVGMPGREFFGMCNIGTRPTIGDSTARTIETNIFDFSEDIYGLDITVTFLRKIRDEVRFSSLPDLSSQLSKDRDYCKSLIVDYL